MKLFTLRILVSFAALFTAAFALLNWLFFFKLYHPGNLSAAILCTVVFIFSLYVWGKVGNDE